MSYGTGGTTTLGLELAGLYDCARIVRELGISRAAAERIMRQLPKVHIDGLRKVYVKGADIETYVASRTVAA